MVPLEESLDIGIHHVAAETNRRDIVGQDRDRSAIVLHEHDGCSPTAQRFEAERTAPCEEVEHQTAGHVLVERREHRFLRPPGERAGAGSGRSKAAALGFTGDDPHGCLHSFRDSASFEPFCIVAEQGLHLFGKLRMVGEVGIILNEARTPLAARR